MVIAYERAVEGQQVQLEMSQAKREIKVYMDNVAKSKEIDAIVSRKRKRRAAGEGEEQPGDEAEEEEERLEGETEEEGGKKDGGAEGGKKKVQHNNLPYCRVLPTVAKRGGPPFKVDRKLLCCG